MFLLTSHQRQAALWTVPIEKLPTSVCTEGQLPILASFNLLILLHLPVKRIHFNPRQAQELKKENLGKAWVKKKFAKTHSSNLTADRQKLETWLPGNSRRALITSVSSSSTEAHHA